MTIQEKYANYLKIAKTGDIGIFRGKALISKAIEITDNAWASHSEVFLWQNDKLMCIDATGKGVNLDFLINTVNSEEDFMVLRVPDTDAQIMTALKSVVSLATNKVRYNYLFYVKFLIDRITGWDLSHITERHADVCSQTVQVYTVALPEAFYKNVDLITPQYIIDNLPSSIKIIVNKGL